MSQDALLAQALAEGASPALVQVLRGLLACACTEPGGTGAEGTDYNGRLAAFDELAPGVTTIAGDGTPTLLLTHTFTVPVDAPPGTLLDIRGWVNGIADDATVFGGNLEVGLNGNPSVFLAQGRDDTANADGSVNLAMEGVLPVTAGDVVLVIFDVESSANPVTINSAPGDVNSTDAWLISTYTSLVL